ncbi:hypothetical protein [Streptomyces sp. NPDC096132]|uniref:hypothetical protein n=1 Tax=Streptomyces sp. NPDC096132 TaxID=3366075 RepID=UPI0037F8E3B7
MPGRATAAVAAKMCAVGVLALVGCTFEDSAGDGSTKAPTDTAVSTATSRVASSSPPAPVTTSPPDSPAPSPSPSISAPASATPTPVPVTGPDQKLVTMNITGGFAGVNQEVVLRGDGTVRVSDKGRSQVRRTTAAQFRKLRTLLGDPALDEVPSFTMNMAATDQFQYTLRFGGRTVMTDRSAEEPALDRLIDALDDWLPKN